MIETEASRGAIKAIGFDLDGTLFDHRASAAEGLCVFFRWLGIDPSDEALGIWFAAEETEFELWRTGAISFVEQRRRRLRSVFSVLSHEFDDQPAYLDYLFARYLAEYRRAWRLYPDVIDSLSTLRTRGYRLGILTNGSEAQQVDKINSLGLGDTFDAVCVSEKIGVQKPDPKAFEILARSLNVETHECMFIGDNPDQDIAGAKSAGMTASLIESKRNGTTRLAAVVDAVLDQARSKISSENESL